MIRIGLIGCGVQARMVHIPALRRLKTARLVAVAEPDPMARAHAARSIPGVQAFEGHEELLAVCAVDAVIVACPPAHHARAAIDALRAGKHVYLEKPMATSRAEAERVLDAWERSGLVGAMAFNYRFNPLLQQLRRDVGDGRAGAVSAVRSAFAISPAVHPPWKTRRAAGGGVLLDLGAHHVDLAHFLFGQEVREICATVRSVRTEADCATVELRLAGGVAIQSFFSLCAAEQDRWQVYGSSGTLTVDRYVSSEVEFTATHHLRARADSWRHAVRRGVPGPYLWAKLRAPLHEPSFVRALDAFVRRVAGSPEDGQLATLSDGCRVARVIEAAEASATRGAFVACSDSHPEPHVSLA